MYINLGFSMACSISKIIFFKITKKYFHGKILYYYYLFYHIFIIYIPRRRKDSLMRPPFYFLAGPDGSLDDSVGPTEVWTVNLVRWFLRPNLYGSDGGDGQSNAHDGSLALTAPKNIFYLINIFLFFDYRPLPILSNILSHSYITLFSFIISIMPHPLLNYESSSI